MKTEGNCNFSFTNCFFFISKTHGMALGALFMIVLCMM